MSEDRKLIYRFEAPWQADKIVEELKEQGIESYTSQTPRAYTKLVMGGGALTELYVDSHNHVAAQRILQKFMLSLAPTELDGEVNYFKRVAWCSILSIVVCPLLFNVAATVNYLKIKPGPNSKQSLGFFVMLVGWVLALAECYLIVSSYFN